MKLTAGRLLYLLYYRPLAQCQRLVRGGSPLDQWRTRRGEAAMREAATRLNPPTVNDKEAKNHEVHLLTGDRFWHQSLFCLWSLSHHSQESLRPVIHDDGSLTPEQVDRFHRVFPQAQVRSHQTMQERLHELLPAESFPTLHERWFNYPHIRKLINPHLGNSGAKLVMDSDLLFFQRADVLFDWLDVPTGPLHAVDCETSYGYPLELMARLAGHEIAPLVNVGLTGLHSDRIDWDQLEYWASQLQAAHGTSYLQEQGLIAMMVAGQDCTIAPASDYVTNPQEPEATSCQAVMHHYVADSKRWYFQKNWRRLLPQPVSP
jgi:hypothetical protein